MFHKPLQIFLDFHHIPHNHLGLTESGPEIEKISSEWKLCGEKCLAEVRGQRLKWADWMEAIENGFIHGLQNNISERTTQSLNSLGSLLGTCYCQGVAAKVASECVRIWRDRETDKERERKRNYLNNG